MDEELPDEGHLDLFDEDAAIEAALAGDDLQRELQASGSILRLIAAQRADAVDALRGLIVAAPNDVVTIAELQGVIRAWQSTLQWVHATLERGDAAVDQIRESQAETYRNISDERGLED